MLFQIKVLLYSSGVGIINSLNIFYFFVNIKMTVEHLVDLYVYNAY